MYKKWIINQDNNTNSWESWLKKFLTEFETILGEVGATDINKKYTWNTSSDTSSKDCNAGDLSDLQAKGYPEWILNLKNFDVITNTSNNAYSTTAYWWNSSFAGNYIDGFLSFTFANIKYCLVYNATSSSGANSSLASVASHVTMLIDYSDVNLTSNTKKYRFSIFTNNASTSYNKDGLITWGTTEFLLIEHYKTTYMDYLTLTLNGDIGSSYYTGGKFLALGNYTISEKYSYKFPGGFLSGGDGILETNDQLMFQSDSVGLNSFINTVYGDIYNSKYLIGKIHYGIKGKGILGQLENSIEINNYLYPLNTRFIIDGIEYKKLRMPTFHNSNITTINRDNYCSVLMNAFHKMEE